jgi:hypothetical protein
VYIDDAHSLLEHIAKMGLQQSKLSEDEQNAAHGTSVANLYGLFKGPEKPSDSNEEQQVSLQPQGCAFGVLTAMRRSRFFAAGSWKRKGRS